MNPNLNRVYLSNRDSGTVTTLDGNNGYQDHQRADDPAMRGHGFCAIRHGLQSGQQQAVYRLLPVPQRGLGRRLRRERRRAELAWPSSPSATAGRQEAAGWSWTPPPGNAFFTNSRADTVSVVGGTVDRVIATVPTGSNPYGAAADPGTNAGLHRQSRQPRRDGAVRHLHSISPIPAPFWRTPRACIIAPTLDGGGVEIAGEEIERALTALGRGVRQPADRLLAAAVARQHYPSAGSGPTCPADSAWRTRRWRIGCAPS